MCYLDCSLYPPLSNTPLSPQEVCRYFVDYRWDTKRSISTLWKQHAHKVVGSSDCVHSVLSFVLHCPRVDEDCNVMSAFESFRPKVHPSNNHSSNHSSIHAFIHLGVHYQTYYTQKTPFFITFCFSGKLTDKIICRVLQLKKYITHDKSNTTCLQQSKILICERWPFGQV